MFQLIAFVLGGLALVFVLFQLLMVHAMSSLLESKVAKDSRIMPAVVGQVSMLYIE